MLPLLHPCKGAATGSIVRRCFSAGLVVLVVGALPTALWAAEDPVRFMSVADWQVTLTRTANTSGTRDYADPPYQCTREWSVAEVSSLTVALPLDPPTQFGNLYRVWNTNSVDSTSPSTIQDSSHEVCIDSMGNTRTRIDTAHASTQFPNLGSVSLSIDTQNGTYTLDPSLLIGYEWDADAGVAYEALFWLPPDPPNGVTIIRPLPATGMTLSGTLTIPMATASQWGGISLATAEATPYMSGSLILTWSLIPRTNEVHVEVEILDARTGLNYTNWLPTGNVHNQETPGSNSLKIISRLVTADGSPAPGISADWFQYEIIGPSHQPGVCMNSPPAAAALANPDLRFVQLSNFPPFTKTLWMWTSDSVIKTFPSSYSMVDGLMCCYDFGAYGAIKVTAMVSGQEIVGYLKDDPDKVREPIRLPARSSVSFIADKWKKDFNVSGKADNDDSDDYPVGDSYPGDGLTLYEEYRGFVQNGQFFRSNPTNKDLFVCDLIGEPESLLGANQLRAQSGLDVHYKMESDEFLSMDDAVVNFNIDGATPHVGPQHGLIMVQEACLVNGRRVSCTDHLGPPGRVSRVKIIPDDFLPARRTFEAKEGSPKLSLEAIKTTAHELSHGCTVNHHGDTDQWTVRWIRVNQPDGGYKVFENSAANEILVLNEDGTYADWVWAGVTNTYKTVWLGAQGGQHSGVQDCFMRYIVADAYVSRLNPMARYTGFTEPIGLGLCDSQQGTGVNATETDKPWPRYGNATRGKCQLQIRVNDH